MFDYPGLDFGYVIDRTAQTHNRTLAVSVSVLACRFVNCLTSIVFAADFGFVFFEFT